MMIKDTVIDSLETYAYRKNDQIIHRKEESRCNNIMKLYEN